MLYAQPSVSNVDPSYEKSVNRISGLQEQSQGEAVLCSIV